MGAWGMKPFENDEALDFIGDSLVEFTNEGTIRKYEQAFILSNESFISSDEAEKLIAAVSFLIDEKNGFVDLSDEDDVKRVNEVYKCNIQMFNDYIKKNVEIDHSKMIQILEVILDEDSSDLAELWYEEDDEEWAEAVSNLIELLREQAS